MGNMIAAHQLDFLEKTIWGPHNCPVQEMLMVFWRIGRPFLHNKDYIVKNLRLLFLNVTEVNIDDYGFLKNWIQEAIDEKYWDNLIYCLRDRHASIPPRPD